jgi:hypothetical protein
MYNWMPSPLAHFGFPQNYRMASVFKQSRTPGLKKLAMMEPEEHMKYSKCILTLAAASVLLPAALAQTPIQQRKDNQQKRIGQGVKKGSLTAGEAARLEKKEAALNREERRMKADGNFTLGERARITRQQNALSRQIYNQKHDAQTQPPANGYINGRKDNQQNRIGQGIKSGSLTPAEAARLESREARLNREEHRMKADGNLSPAERARINRQQNQISKGIYRQKHDAQHR